MPIKRGLKSGASWSQTMRIYKDDCSCHVIEKCYSLCVCLNLEPNVHLPKLPGLYMNVRH